MMCRRRNVRQDLEECWFGKMTLEKRLEKMVEKMEKQTPTSETSTFIYLDP